MHYSDYILDEDSLETLFDAFGDIHCSNIEPDFDSFENLPLPKGVFDAAAGRDVPYVILGVSLETVDNTRGLWITMRPYLWEKDMQAIPAFNSKERFRIAVIEGVVNQSVLFAQKKLNTILEDAIITWESVDEDQEDEHTSAHQGA